MKVSGVVVSHGHARELEGSLPALAPQVDELVVVANLPGSTSKVPAGVRVLENPGPLSFAANVNVGIAATNGEYVLVCNPDAVAEPDAVTRLVAFADARPRCGIAGPQLLWPDGTWQPSRRRFPTVRGPSVRRTPLRRFFPPLETLDRVNHNAAITGWLGLTLGLVLAGTYSFAYRELNVPQMVWGTGAWVLVSLLALGRMVRGWQARRAAVYASIAFATVVILYVAFRVAGPSTGQFL